MLVIHHRPLGNEHPYESSPVERMPRQPLAGEAVTFGAQCTPAAAASGLICWFRSTIRLRSALLQNRFTADDERTT